MKKYKLNFKIYELNKNKFYKINKVLNFLFIIFMNPKLKIYNKINFNLILKTIF